jgi:O-antigen ligase
LIAQSLRTFKSKLSWRTVMILLLIAALFVPLIVGTGFFFPYVVPRNLFFRVVIELAAATLVLALCFRDKSLDLRDEPVFWSLAAFVAAAAVSALFSPARTHSFFGDFERMGGVWAWLHLFLFFLLLRTLRDKDWTWILNAALGVGLFVAVTAIAQHSDFARTQTPDAAVAPSAATLGNSGLLAAYLLMSIAVAAYLAATHARYRLLYLSAAALDLLSLVYAENRSTILGLVLGAIVGGAVFAMLAATSKRKWIVPMMALLFGAVVGAGVLAIRAFPSGAVARNLPGVLVRMAGTNFAGADESRTMQWRAAIEGFKDRPLTGYGLENHNLVWSAHFDPDVYKVDTDIYDRTHNQFLEVLGTTGLLGTMAFLAIWLAIGVTLVRAYRAGRLSPTQVAILVATQIAYATYLFFWFVDINSTMLWILLAALIASRGTVGSIVLEATEHDALAARPRPAIALASLAVLCVVLYAEGFTPLRANLALARLDIPSGSVEKTLAEFDVLTQSSGRQTAHTPILMAQYVGSLRPRLAEMSANPEKRRMLERAFAEAMLAFDREIQRDSLNDRLYTHQGELFVEVARFYKSADYRQKAIDAFHTAMDLSPRRIEPRLALAALYKGDDDYERAVVVLSDAVKIDPQLGEPRYRLAEAYMGAGQSDSALAMLQSSLKLGYVGPPEAYLSMGKRLEFSGRNTTAARLYSNYLEAKYTEAVWDASESIDQPVPTLDIAVAAHLPLLYMRARDSELAIKSAAALSAFDPSRSKIVDRFVSDVGSRRRAGWVAKNSLLPCKSGQTSRTRDSIPPDPCRVFRGKL